MMRDPFQGSFFVGAGRNPLWQNVYVCVAKCVVVSGRMCISRKENLFFTDAYIDRTYEQ